MKKRLLALLVVGAMLASTIVGCGGAAAEEEDVAPNAGATTDAGDDADAGEETGDDAEAPVEKFERFDELQTIKIKCMDIIPSDNTARDAAINAIAEEKLNVHVEIEQVDIVSYMTQLPLTLSSGEAFDLVMFTAIPACGFTTMQAQKQLMDVTEYVDEYASDAKEILGQYLQATTVDGKVYGFPNYRQYDSGVWLMMDEDVLDDLGLTEKARNMTTWAEVEEIFEAVAPNLDKYGIKSVFGAADNQGTMLTSGETICSGDAFADSISYDSLGDTYKFMVTDFASNKVLNRFETPEYQQAIDRILSWYDKGWVYKAALTDQDNSGDTGFNNGMFFAHLGTAEFGCELVKENESGGKKNLVCVELSKIPVNTQSGRQWGWGVPATSENPEAAVAFINLMYSDPAIANLFCYGIEGDDYEVVDGEAHINYAKEGVYMSGDFLYSNQFNALPKQGMGADFREKALANMANHPVSPYFGIAIDATPIADEITNIKSVLDQYQIPLEAGQNVCTTAELSQKCLDAGLQTVLDFYQGEVDNFLANK